MVKIGLLVEEFYEKDLGGYGGYGILAREYIAKYIPNEEFLIEVIIGTNKQKKVKTLERDGTKIHFLPKNYSSKYDIDFIYLNLVKKFFKEQKYDIYLSIEMSKIAYEVMRREKDKKLILWIQDPRPAYDWEEIKTISNSNEYDSYLNYYSKWEKPIKKLLKKLVNEGRLILISQGRFLKQKAIDLYQLPQNIQIQYFPNPVEINEKKINKKNSVVFLGRIVPVKRPWIYCELAKYFPNIIFYVCGDSENLEKYKIKYKDVRNLKFMGHVSGELKEKLLSESKVLINTSIHEAIPVSFLEAISYGTKILSCQNPDDITKNNGYFTGTILGDGLNEIEKFKIGLNECFNNYDSRKMSEMTIKIKEEHSIENFIINMRKLIKENI